jgi:sugar/nucleoside kinase (ribokinase family)
MFTAHSVFSAPAYPLEAVFDPTGAGDSFAGGFMGYLSSVNNLSDEAVRQAIIFGSVMASFNVEKFSLERMRTLDIEQIRDRYRKFQLLTQFKGVD